jgi:hypothetical protein
MSIIGDETSVIKAVQMIGAHIDDSSSPFGAAAKLIHETLPEFEVKDKSTTFLRFVAQSMTELYLNDQVVTVDVVEQRATKLIEKSPYFNLLGGDVQQVSPNAPVTISAPKKQSKQERAMELYQQNPEMDTKAFRDLLMKELGMTTSGAATYSYNCRKVWK